ncbi:ORF6C domain-containing protein [Staphylococcus nepalensis]|uniref:BRO family protein n=1 Tax=Staphylococcus TaxID=1279 RepID=UPI002982B698|nr:ORF6C domain-containing protein [Staphylococcus equorum]MDW5471740.1 ORF6C domain-containing protein [Staphylococcus equorum]
MTELKVLEQKDILGNDFMIYGTAEEPLFLAKDIAEWIDYSKTSQGYYNVSKMLMTIDEDEKTTITNSNSGGSKVFLTEQGVYEVLMQSQKKIAKVFKKQVKEILKEIRKTGSYKPPMTANEQLTLTMQAQLETKEQVDYLQDEVQDLKENQRLDTGEYNQVSISVSNRVKYIKSAYNFPNANEVNKELYKDMNGQIKRMTGIVTRTQLKQRHFNDVLDMILNWYPSQSTVFLINQSINDDNEQQAM